LAKGEAKVSSLGGEGKKERGRKGERARTRKKPEKLVVSDEERGKEGGKKKRGKGRLVRCWFYPFSGFQTSKTGCVKESKKIRSEFAKKERKKREKRGS